MLNKVGRDIPTNIPALEGREVYQGEFAIEPKAKRAKFTAGTDCTGYAICTHSGKRKYRFCKGGIGQDGFRIATAHEQQRIYRRIRQATQLRI